MSKATRRAVLAGIAAVIAAPGRSYAAWPDQAITLVHGFAPGGGADVTARIIGEALSQRVGQPVLVESKAGAGSTIASAQVARAAPDGHTLMMVGSAFATSAAMYKTLSYRAVEDFTMIGKISEFPYLLVTYSDHPVRNIADLVSTARARTAAPLLYGTNGQGSTQHLLIELFARMANVKLQHVPFRGGAQALTEVLAKRIDFMIDPPIIFLQHIKEDRLRPLATTSIKRFSDLPDVPTIAESGFPNFDVSSWFGLLGPAGLPEPIVSRLNLEMAGILANPDIQKRLRGIGIVPASSSPDEFKTLVTGTIAKWTSVIADAQIERI